MEKKATVVINGQTIEMPRIAIAAENLALKATKAEKAGVQLLMETSKADLRDQRLQVENLHLREKLKKLGLEYEKLKEQKQGGLLVMPDPAVNELEFEMFASPPEEILERIKQHPEELEDMIRKKYAKYNGK